MYVMSVCNGNSVVPYAELAVLTLIVAQPDLKYKERHEVDQTPVPYNVCSGWYPIIKAKQLIAVLEVPLEPPTVFVPRECFTSLLMASADPSPELFPHALQLHCKGSRLVVHLLAWLGAYAELRAQEGTSRGHHEQNIFLSVSYCV
jgi:hypothetical protein